MKKVKRPDVMMIGLRSPFGVQGGVETHVCALSVQLAYQLHSLEIVCRSRYHDSSTEELAPNIRCTSIWAPASAHMEAFAHTFLGILYARMRSPAILHIHGIGPALMAPLARALGLRVVTTHHGKDYERQKWNRFAKLALRIGEFCAARFSNVRICIARTLTAELSGKYGVPFHFVPNGVTAITALNQSVSNAPIGLMQCKYILNVGRFVPEKRQDDLIRAFAMIDDADVRLVLVGASDHESPYDDLVRREAARDDRVLLVGQQFGATLSELFHHAAGFALPSSHEGLPIALLEAMSCGLPLAISDIPPLMDMRLSPECYVGLGDTVALAERLRVMLAGEIPARVDWSHILKEYDWSVIAERTIELYASTVRDRSSFHVPAMSDVRIGNR